MGDAFCSQESWDVTDTKENKSASKYLNGGKKKKRIAQRKQGPAVGRKINQE